MLSSVRSFTRRAARPLFCQQPKANVRRYTLAVFPKPCLVRPHCEKNRSVPTIFHRWHATSAPAPVYRTLAFYKFHSLPEEDLPAFREELLAQFGAFGAVGRIYISTEGINVQVSCPEPYLDEMQRYCERVIKPKLGGDLMDFNWSTDEPGRRAFRALHVRIRKQLVADGLDPASYDLKNRPSHLPPAAWHEKLETYKAQHGKEPILIDMRNHYESNIGYFDGAIRPDADTFRDSIKAMNEIVKDIPRDQEIFMYCTGGIRCSKAGAILQSASGFDTVHLVEGGITAYGRWIQEQKDKKSLFRGKNFTFDGRLGEPVTEEVFGQCHICGGPCNRYQNCVHSSCNLLMLCCDTCASRFLNTCGRPKCYDVVHDYKQSAQRFYNPDGPVLVNGVRAYIKEKSDRVVIGKQGEKCAEEHNRRIRAVEVLGEPGEILKEWVRLGRTLP
ncbi:hypothetical protein BCR43DRAFT_522007 [Syncephalastrum racemosum]|uniref:Rhodanese domain-containing protein n=1 Tax=Syncephalastrum racemosum TaxID=13706 RepID=A0A1X2HNZ4_SYNRA|nr:hypothetical protein BCR43DRAFT_522007 [Syncephalastrum racemosum]